MSRPLPEHGTLARRLGCQTRPPCLCTMCVRGARKQKKANDFRRSQGVTGYVPSGPVNAHVRRLLGSGRSLAGIARAAGVDVATVRRVLSRPKPTVWRTTAEKLLAVPEIPDEMALLDSTGTVRRLRALVVMGHPQKVLADEVGCAFTYISMLTHDQRAQVTVALEQAVRRAYGRLSMTVGMSSYGRVLARKYGWHGPLAWDDDTIDDPRVVPQTDAVEPIVSEGGNLADRWLMGESVILGPEDRKAVLAHLFEWTNATAVQIAARLDMTPEAADRQWHRIKEKAAVEGRRVWRRAYVPRGKSLNQNQMKEAA